MKNMELPPNIQQNVHDFLLSTQASLDNQTELDEFFSFINPTLREQVSLVIFTRAIKSNEIFKEHPDCVAEFVLHTETLLVLPDQ